LFRYGLLPFIRLACFFCVHRLDPISTGLVQERALGERTDLKIGHYRLPIKAVDHRG
jgi:hypothetical protein